MKRWKAIAVASTAALAMSVALFASPTSPVSAGAGTPFEMHIDCDTGTAGIQSNCTFPASPSSITVDVVLVNNSGASADINSFQFDVVTDDKASFTPPAQGDGNLNGNPDFLLSPIGSWSCNPPGPNPDLDRAGDPANRARSVLVCFNGTGSTSLANGASLPLGRVTYNVASANETTSFGLENVQVTLAPIFFEAMSCNPEIDIVGNCVGADVVVGAPSGTATPVPTNTPTPVGTATPVSSPTSLAFITVTLTASATVPATAPPGGGETPGAGPTQPGGQIPPGEGPGGAPGGGGQGPITLPDTGTGSNDTSPWSTLLAFGGLAIALGGVAGGIYFRKLRAQTARNED